MSEEEEIKRMEKECEDVNRMLLQDYNNDKNKIYEKANLNEEDFQCPIVKRIKMSSIFDENICNFRLYKAKTESQLRSVIINDKTFICISDIRDVWKSTIEYNLKENIKKHQTNIEELIREI